MTSKFSWRKVLAVPAILSLALGCALLAAAPANAAEAGLTVTAPAEGATTASRTVTVSGSVFGGSIVIVYAADGTTELSRTNAGGQFNTPTPYTVTLPVYADNAAAAQTIKVGGLYGGSGIPQQTVNFTLPAVAPVFAVTSPTEGQALTSRTVAFSGTGTNGSTVNVLDNNGDRIPGTTAAVVTNGTWTTTGTYADDAAAAQTITAKQTTGGAGRGEQTVNFTIPAPVPAYNFAVTSPTNGQALTSRTVVFTGTGTNGSTVNVLDANGDRIPGTTAAVVSNGTWTTTGTYADDAAVAQTVTVNQVTGGAGRGEQTVSFTIPAVAPAYNFAVTSPTNGQALTSRTVVFTGTGTNGSTVNVLDANGDRIPGTTAAVVTNGTWTTTGTYADDAALTQTITANQVTGGAGRGEQTVTFTLPANLLPAPVITSPTNGQVIAGETVTFTGTGTPNTNVLLLVVPTDLLNQPTARAAAPADPTDPILVDAAGNWTVTLALAPEDYTAAAVLVELNDQGELVNIISEPSNEVEFTLVAAATPVTPAGSGTPGSASNTGAATKNQLASTGSAPAGLIGLASLMALAGAATLVLRKKASIN